MIISKYILKYHLRVVDSSRNSLFFVFNFELQFPIGLILRDDYHSLTTPFVQVDYSGDIYQKWECYEDNYYGEMIQQLGLIHYVVGRCRKWIHHCY